jgi:hypothetical protein
MHEVRISKKALKSALKMPRLEQIKLNALVSALAHSGASQPMWPNYSILDKRIRTHHCHLSYHWVACWQETNLGIEIEVYYAGSRESAPY